MTAQLPAGVTLVDCSTLDRPNAYVIDDGETTLVDAGWPGDEAAVRDGLHDAGVAPADIDRVLLTHYDADHVGTLARLTPALDAPVHVHERERPYVAGDRLPPWTARNGLEALHRLYYRRLSLPDLPVCALGDGDDIGGFRAYHTPGHTPGHVAYVHEGLSVAFLGDLVYGLGDDLRPTGRLTSYDAAGVTDSVRSLCRRAPEFEYACPGHGPPLANGSDRLANAVR
jgi:glyoxylase-like metal-dependent hydrolase (beta-lactamase superfamily II)